MSSIRPCLLALFFCFATGNLFAATTAQWITSGSQLLEGPEAVGQVGDILLANDEISIVITSIGHPHGYANTGGNIIDAALTSDRLDFFGQLYPYLDDDWPRQADYSSLSIINDGSGGSPARVRATGVDSNNSAIAVVTDYVLADGSTEVLIASTVTNNSGTAMSAFELGDATEWENLTVFAPGYGFEVSGTTTENWIAAVSGDLAYGYFGSGDPMWGPNGNGWSDINILSADIIPGSWASCTRYFHVGRGGVATVTRRAHAIAGLTVGTLSGSVATDDTGAPLSGATVDIYDGSGSLYSQMIMDSTGEGQVTLIPGTWQLIAMADGYQPADQWITINADASTSFAFLMNEGTSTGSYALGDTLTVIQRPLLNIPSIVEEGGSLTIQCKADPATLGWAATLKHGPVEVFLPLDSAVYDPTTTWWNLTVDVPAVELHELYDLRVTAFGGLDDTARHAVQIIESEPEDFYFLQITDTHLPTHIFYYDSASETDTTEVMDLRAVIQDAELIHPAFVLVTGDLINEGELEDFEQRRYYSRSQQILSEFTVPLYLIAGNHDIGGWDDTPPSAGTARRDWWRFYGWSILDDPPPGAPLHTQNYSFDFGGVHFTALESYDNYDMWRSEIYGADSFTFDQLQWLQDDLDAATESLSQVLFFHYDFSNQLNLNSLEVEMALWGHIHKDSGSLSAPPYDLATDQVCDGGRSYRLVRVHNGVLDPCPTLQAGSSGQNLRVAYAPSNIGAADSVTATITNNLSEGFPYGQVVFQMPEFPTGVEPTVDGGTLTQIDDSGDVDLWYVDVDIAALGTTIVTAHFDRQTDSPIEIPGGLILHSPYPNPFNPSTTLEYSLPRDGHVRVAILDVRGREIVLLVDRNQEKGEHSLVWNGTDRAGHRVPSGTYIAQIHSGDSVRTAKLSLIK